jgi:hypothetical protein
LRHSAQSPGKDWSAARLIVILWKHLPCIYFSPFFLSDESLFILFVFPLFNRGFLFVGALILWKCNISFYCVESEMVKFF